MKFFDLLTLAGFSLMVAALYLRYGLEAALGFSGGMLFICGLLMAHRTAKTGVKND
ncbi:hypothetical protein [Pantoea sp. YU22]|uniref:hypothetical protein n=1 Tax=Pantoea sp. YU22 TaxID=2497684 RepID=UPI00268F80FF|nr:hypothetical protein [Pantoea sp. YU22]